MGVLILDVVIVFNNIVLLIDGVIVSLADFNV